MEDTNEVVEGQPPAGPALRHSVYPARRHFVPVVTALACLAAVLLHCFSLARPALFLDDFQILHKAWTWERARASLWLPSNEHVMPLGRLSTWGLVQAGGRIAVMPTLARLQGPAALVAGMFLAGLFIRRELGHPFYALVAMILFGVTTLYEQAVIWFSASFALLAVDSFLLALLAAQRWRQTGRGYHLALAALWASLAPGWFASGLLAGPLTSLYLLFGARSQGLRRRLCEAAIPLLGTIQFVAVTVSQPSVTDHIMHLEHYGDKTAVQAFHPVRGLAYSARSVVENLALGQVGVGSWGLLLPNRVAWGCALLLTAAAAWWLWRAPHLRLAVLGLGTIVISYWLVYSARGEWDYTEDAFPLLSAGGHTLLSASYGGFTAPRWDRYHLLPQIGLTFFLLAGLPRWDGRLFSPDPSGRLNSRQAVALVLWIAILFVIHFPRSLAARWNDTSPTVQLPVLRRIDAVDARCHEQRIRADTARAALGFLDIPGCHQRENGWDFLRGSDDPQPWSVEEARQLLLP